MPADTLMEDLYRLRDSLEGRPYAFYDWTSCTAGHIYYGATGEKARQTSRVTHPGLHRRRYRRLLRAIVSANRGSSSRWSASDNAQAVSDLTVRARRGDSTRKAALRLVNRTIEVEEGRQRRAMGYVARMKEEHVEA